MIQFRVYARSLLYAVAAMTLASCGLKKVDASSKLTARQMTANEALADFEEIVASVRTLYGPLDYKQQRFGFNLNDTANEFRGKIQAAKSDVEFFGLYAQFLTRLQDAHVSVSFTSSASNIRSYTIGLYLIPVEGKALVVNVGADLVDQGIKYGDEVTAVDGVAPADIAKTIAKYRSMANPVSELNFVNSVFARASHLAELVPQSPLAHVEFKRKDGSTYVRDLSWHKTLYSDIPDRDVVKGPATGRAVIESGLQIATNADADKVAHNFSMGSVVPFFITDAVTDSKSLIRVSANETYLKKYKLDPASHPDVFAALYQHKGKLVLLVRQPSYSHNPPEKFSNADYMNEYRAILDQYENVAQVLVVDQTHNGGGSYCEDFFRLFIQEQKGGFVQRLHADRKWMVDLRTWTPTSGTDRATEADRAMFAAANFVERAYDSGKSLTDELVPLMSGESMVRPDAEYTWKKPFLVLIDELSASCADAFPAFVKAGHVAPLFGERSMGAGGNVEETVTTSNARATVRLTRGLFTAYKPSNVYEAADWVENNGVTPDIAYKHTVDDVRAGYTRYVDTFSDSAIALIK